MLHFRYILLLMALLCGEAISAQEIYHEHGHKPIKLRISQEAGTVRVGKLSGIQQTEDSVYEAIIRELWRRGATQRGSMQQFARVVARNVLIAGFNSGSNQLVNCGNDLSLSIEDKKNYLDYVIAHYEHGTVTNLLKSHQGDIEFVDNTLKDEALIRALIRLTSRYQFVPNDKVYISADNNLHIGSQQLLLTPELAMRLSGAKKSNGNFDISAGVYISGDNQDKDCNCEGFGADSVEIYAMRNCNGCTDHNLLIYDAKCKQFWQYTDENMRKVVDVSDIRLFYKKQFKIKVIRLNRYLHSVNIGNSDITFTSTPSVQMQSALPGSGTGQVTVFNSGTDNISNSSATNIFNEITGIRADANYLIDIFRIIQQKWHVEQDIFYLNLKDPSTHINYDQELKELFDNIKVLDNLKIKRPELQAKAEEISKLLESDKNDAKKSQTLALKADTSNARLNRGKIQDFIAEYYTYANSNHTIRANFPMKIKGKNSTLPDAIILIESKTAIEQKPVMDRLDGLVDSLENSLRDFLAFYDTLMDNKVLAYSICTKKFPCCGETGKQNYSYSDFDTKLADLNKAYLAFRSFYNDPENKKRIQGQGTGSASTNSAIKKDTTQISLDITGSKLILTGSKITGLQLEQKQETSTLIKPSAPKVNTEEEINTAFLKLDSMLRAFQRIPSTYIMQQILFSNNLVEDNMSYTTAPIFPYGDRLGLILQIGPSDSVTKLGILPISVENIALDFPVYGKPVFSFSGGTYIGFGGSLLQDSYSWQQVPTSGNVVQSTSPSQLVKTGKSQLPIGVFGAANVAFKTRAKFGLSWGVSAGVGATYQDQLKSSYFLAATLSLGSYQQFHFHFGGTAMNVDRIDDYSQYENKYYYNPGSVPYTKKLETGWFFGISYTLFTPKGTNPVQNVSGPTGPSFKPAN